MTTWVLCCTRIKRKFLRPTFLDGVRPEFWMMGSGGSALRQCGIF
jgi:hypothetical protein